MIGKLLDIATMGSTLAGVGLMQRYLSGMAKIIVLAIVSAFLLCSMLAGLFTFIYFGLIHYGVESNVAWGSLGIVVVFLTIAFIITTVDQLKQLRDLSHFSSNKFKNDGPNLGSIINAFVDGFRSNKK